MNMELQVADAHPQMMNQVIRDAFGQRQSQGRVGDSQRINAAVAAKHFAEEERRSETAEARSRPESCRRSGRDRTESTEWRSAVRSRLPPAISDLSRESYVRRQVCISLSPLAMKAGIRRERLGENFWSRLPLLE